MKKRTNDGIILFIRNTLSQYFMTFAQYLFPFITFPYLTRVLEPNTYGIVIYLTSTVMYFQILIDFGFNLSATAETSINRNNSIIIGEILYKTIVAKILLGILSIFVFTLMILFIKILRENFIVSYLYLFSVLISIFLPDFIFRGLEVMQIITKRYIFTKGITTILVFVLVKSSSDLYIIPLLSILGTLISILLTNMELRRMQIKMYKTRFSEVINSIKASSNYFLSTFATTAFGATNAFVMGIVNMPNEQIAYWGISYNLINAAQSLYSPIVNSLYPRMVLKKDFKLAKNILKIFMPAILITVVIVYIFSPTIIQIFSGPGYEDSIDVLRFLLPVLIFSFPAMIIGFPVLGVIGKVKETSYTTILSAFFHIFMILIIILLGKFTIIAIAIIRSITEFVLFFTRAIILKKSLPLIDKNKSSNQEEFNYESNTT